MRGKNPSVSKANQLISEVSPYLRSAAHQPVNWYPWTERAFEVAQRENKPILLDIGAIWCHWCHVMDRESYENEVTAKIINDNYIAVKVDRDERPDIDSRYQTAVSAVSGQGGWPLTAFMTPTGLVFFGGTYFPPEDRYGRVGFPRVLKTLADAFRGEPEKILENVQQINRVLEHPSSESANHSVIGQHLVDSALSSIIEQFDVEHGGFGSAPKFPHCSTLELLLACYDRTKDDRLLDVVNRSLKAMANGGIHDQLGGGFHRYSTDEKWIVPHFEKMLYDNAALLTTYVHASKATGDRFFRDVALGIDRFVRSVLADNENGGFLGSQDADISPDDDGSYFTWTLAEVKESVSPDEFECLRLRFGISDIGQMHSDPKQNVLHIRTGLDEIALKINKGVFEVAEFLRSGCDKLQALRSARKAPYVDESIYADWNGMMISAYLEAYKAFSINEMRDFALRSLNRLLSEHRNPDGTISHRAATLSSEGFLADQVEISQALLQAFEVTAEGYYLDQATALVDLTLARFSDVSEGGFFDVPTGKSRLGLLSITVKPTHDSPVSSANSVAIRVLSRLWSLTGFSKYREFAEKSLVRLSSAVGRSGIYAASYHHSLEEFLDVPPHVAIIYDPADESGRKLFQTALETYRPGKTVAAFRPQELASVPEILRGTLRSYSRPVAYVCSHSHCAPPAYDPDALRSTIKTFGHAGNN